MKTFIQLTLILALMAFAVPSYATSTAQLNGVVNVNTATKEQLVMVPGIGEAKADAIIAQRSVSPFKNADDLLVIKGIGEKVLTKINPYVVIQGATTIQTQKTQKN